jgi:hypothetical protein
MTTNRNPHAGAAARRHHWRRAAIPALALALLLCAAAGSVAQEAAPAQPEPSAEAESPVTRSGDLYRTRLSGIDDFHAVVEILRAELFHRGWTQQNQVDLDIMLRSEGMLVHDKLIAVYDPERFADAIAKRPTLGLLAAQGILVYQEMPERAQSYRAAPGDIVIELVDPAVRAAALEFRDIGAVEALRGDLTDAMAATERFFRGPEAKSALARPAAGPQPAAPRAQD